MHRESKRMLVHSPKEQAIYWSKGEGWGHYIAKCLIVRLLKEGVPVNLILDAMGEFMYAHVNLRFITNKYKVKHKNWELPKVFTEAKFGKQTADIFISSSLEGRAVIEIVDNEVDKSIERKKKYFKGKKIAFYVVKVRP